MLSVRTIEIKNFLSIGALPQKVDFTGGDLVLVMGEDIDAGGGGHRNGVGKSTILQAISFAIYGKGLTSIKVDNLINDKNSKNMKIVVEFDKDGKNYKIERGRKPNILNFYVDDGLVKTDNKDEAQGENRQTQHEIERAFGMSHALFSQIVCMNTLVTPFLSMAPKDQREIIEELLGIMQLGEKSTVLNLKIKETRDALREEEIKNRTIEEANNRVIKNITELKTKSQNWENKKNVELENISSNIERLNELDIEKEIKNHEFNSDLKLLKKEFDTVTKKISLVTSNFIFNNKQLDKLKTQKIKLETNTCPTCNQNIENDGCKDILADIDKTLVDVEVEIKKIEEEREPYLVEQQQYQEVISSMGNYLSVVYNNINDALEHKNNLKSLNDELVKVYNTINPYLEQIEYLEKNNLVEIDKDSYEKLIMLREHQEFLYKLLTDKNSPIRKKIINQSINYLNFRLKYYLEKLESKQVALFNNDLSVSISSRGRDKDFEQLSRGERQRFILSLGFAFRDMWESINSQMNLMFIDELLDNGLDQVGVNTSLEILKNMARDRGKNVFLISHREELFPRVNKILKVIMENGFTRFETDVNV